ncbi:hypothetical protein MLD38_009017 [Melastoma candidum]|uniref:Uncharacterized protein n=1 Tax=Melastoma candidum TaxID=119954 RepID=A0ACB9RY46_9MYRT|nr:hypothetical protein MLD38_009017 [Melastoma candidum]
MLRTIGSAICREEPNLLRETCLKVASFCNSNSSDYGICVHSPVLKLGLHDDLYLNNNLLTLYARCRGVGHARLFFDEMPLRDVVSWTGLLSAHVRDDDHEGSVMIFRSMLVSDEAVPNEFTLSNVLRSCSAAGRYGLGACIHARVVKCGYEASPVILSNLIDMYSECRGSEEAFEVFEPMIGSGSMDIVCWTSMIASLGRDDRWRTALELYARMISAGVCPTELTFVKLLSASGDISLKLGMALHAQIVTWGMVLNLILKTALVDMYLRYQSIADAKRVFGMTQECDVGLWTTIISGFANNSMDREAVDAFHQMEMTGIKGNSFTYSSLLNVCQSNLLLELARQIHARVISVGLERDHSVGKALLNLYMKVAVEDGIEVFRSIVSPNVITWTSFIAGLAFLNNVSECFYSFREMLASGVEPNSITFSSFLAVFHTAKSLHQVLQVHAHIIKRRANHDIAVGNALVDLYAGFELFDEAFNIFDRMDKRDAITYTSLAAAMNHTGHHGMVLSLVRCMKEDDVKMDDFSLACSLSASTCLGQIEIGKQLHCHSIKSGHGGSLSVSNGLIDLYGKCSSAEDARKAFKDLAKPDVISWNALISGLASEGDITAALSTFEDMKISGIRPDSITFLLVVSACSHGRLVDLGLENFQSFVDLYNLVPDLHHYACLVNLLGRAGQLEEAWNVIQTMPLKPSTIIYKEMITACCIHKNMLLGEEVARLGIELDPSNPALHLLLARLYDACGRSDLSDKTRERMKTACSKNMARSDIEKDYPQYAFVA